MTLLRWFSVGLFLLPFALQAEPFRHRISTVDLISRDGSADLPVSSYGTFEAAQSAAAKAKLKRAIFRIHFEATTSFCAQDMPAIGLGYLYDQDSAYLNGRLIGATGAPGHSLRRLSLLPRVYALPKSFLICPGQNVLELDVRRILGGWIGPTMREAEIGDLTQLQEAALKEEAIGPLFQRDIGIVLLAMSILLVSLFYRYPDNIKQSAFASFTFAAALLCLSLSSWYYRYLDFPEVVFRLHFVVVSAALLMQIRFVAIYRGFSWPSRLPATAVFTLAGGALAGLTVAIRSTETLLSVYVIALAVLILASLAVYAWPLIAWFKDCVEESRAERRRRAKELNAGIEAALLVLHFGSAADVARIWGLHPWGNISPYTYGVSIFAIGSMLAADLVEVFKRSARSAELESAAQQAQTRAEIATQVAHDIRSPLSALNLLIGSQTNLPEDRRRLMKHAVQRMNDIANGLLQSSRNDREEAIFSRAPTVRGQELLVRSSGRETLIPSLLDSIVSEKRMQLRERTGVEIVLAIEKAHGLFASINRIELSRALSNLIDNAVYAIDGDGRVTVGAAPRGSSNIAIWVEDNGRGMPPEVLARAGERGFSYGKGTSGNGLGLHHARAVITAMKGHLEIRSVVGKGTDIVAVLPMAPAPDWFVEKLAVGVDQAVVCLDDDRSIHELWRQRLGEAGIRPLSVSTANEFERWLSSSSGASMILMDYDLGDGSPTGIDLIERHRLLDRAILVSSHIDEPEVRERAKRLGIRMMPKSAIPFAPIELI